MFKKYLNKLVFILVAITVSSCAEDAVIVPIDNNEFSDIYSLPKVPYNYNDVVFPETFSTQTVLDIDNTPENNPITNDGATLGRVIFYDKKLSFNKTTSCATCHSQELSFANNTPKSLGFEGGHTRRNSMHIVNARFYEPNLFFWDHRASSLEEQVLMPFQDGLEMGMTLELLIERVNVNYYKPLFKNVFGNEEITSAKIAKVLAQFIRSIYSFSTKYDIGIQATNNIFVDFPNFTVQENMGKDIFNGKLTPETNGTCAFCHIFNYENLHFSTTPSSVANQVIFSSERMDNIGLDENSHGGVDNGLGELTNVDADNGQFKAPSLRNIELTAPYMHDGRFETLEEVVEHYSTGVKNHSQLSDHLINADETPRHLNLTDEESAALVAFLKTLTDEVMINDVKYSDPFVN